MTPDALILWYEEVRTTRGNPPSFDPMGIWDERCKACRNGHCISVVWERSADRKRREKNPQYRGGLQRKEVCALCWSRNADEVGVDEAGRITPEWMPIQRADACNAIQPPIRRGAAESRLAEETDVWLRLSAMVNTVPPGTSPYAWSDGITAILESTIVQASGERFDAGSFMRGHTRESLEASMSHVRWWLRRRIDKARWRQEEIAMGEEFLSPAEVAAELGMSERTVRRWIKRGAMKAVRLESDRSSLPRWGIPRTEVERYRKRRTDPSRVTLEQTGHSGQNSG